MCAPPLAVLRSPVELWPEAPGKQEMKVGYVADTSETRRLDSFFPASWRRSPGGDKPGWATPAARN